MISIQPLLRFISESEHDKALCEDISIQPLLRFIEHVDGKPGRSRSISIQPLLRFIRISVIFVIAHSYFNTTLVKVHRKQDFDMKLPEYNFNTTLVKVHQI